LVGVVKTAASIRERTKYIRTSHKPAEGETSQNPNVMLPPDQR